MNDFERALRIRDIVLAKQDWEYVSLRSETFTNFVWNDEVWVILSHRDSAQRLGMPANWLELWIWAQRELHIAWDFNRDIWINEYYPGSWEQRFFGLPEREGSIDLRADEPIWLPQSESEIPDEGSEP